MKNKSHLEKLIFHRQANFHRASVAQYIYIYVYMHIYCATEVDDMYDENLLIDERKVFQDVIYLSSRFIYIYIFIYVHTYIYINHV